MSRIRLASLAFGSALVFGGLAQRADAAPLDAAVSAPIRAALTAIDAGDAAAFARAFSPDATIVDEISPFAFAGPDAARTWFARLLAVNRANEIADEHGTFAAPHSGSIEGDAAYAVVPVRISYRQRGRAFVENGAWTFVLRNARGTWKITHAAFAAATS